MKGVHTCFKNINLCDQHPVCDPGEKTGEIAKDEFDCFEEYKKGGLTPKDATYQCQSVHHNEASVAANLSLGIVMIEAVPCDGNPTCWKPANQNLAPDESFCDNDLLAKWVPGERYDLKGKIRLMKFNFSDSLGCCNPDNAALVIDLCTSLPKKSNPEIQ